MAGNSIVPVIARGRARRLAAVFGVLVAAVAPFAAPSPASANVLVVDTLRPDAGPYGAISVIGDSVLLGSGLVTPTASDELAAQGWGPIRFRASVGMSTGTVGSTSQTTAVYWIERWRSEGWDPENIVVNLGANDSGLCGSDVACARERIQAVLDAIGPGKRIWWPKITRFPTFADQANAWNTALDQLAAGRDDLFIWDWPTAMYAHGEYEWDHTHLTAAGYIHRNALIGIEATADLVQASRTGSAATLPAPAGSDSEVVPVGPVRLLDTRSDAPGRLRAGGVVEIDLSAEIPAGSTAAAVYVTAVTPTDRGFLTAWDCSGSRPTASAVNYAAATNRGAVTLVPLSATGTFCLFTRSATDIVVDLQAAFVPTGSGGAKFSPLDTPQRLLDTRVDGGGQDLEIAVPDGAEMVAVSIAAIGTGRPGFLTAYGCTADRPVIATVNHGASEVVGGTAFVPVSPDGTICVYVKSGADVTVDLTGTFAADGELVFVPVAPTRTIDTRSAIGGWGPLHGAGQSIDAPVAPADAAAVSGTLTIVEPLRAGHLRAYSCGTLPETANVNAAAGLVLANSLTTGVDASGRLCVFARSATGTVFDTTGWWVPAS